ncbi:hypothetical protein DPEC_G00199750 [Dallia pectoralis]|uniref:Uncharacterized protein n=1 Tax=Dallia pectoralis TaxID=75939 RepID=A0ACC2G8Q4_DALPE|nr:hypothetical protein DPEC_G00199750 [Dallia pectoralis]
MNTVQADQRSFCKNRNVKKLCTICMVSSLTRSWQKWVSELEDKQAKVPVGWAPDSLSKLWDEPPKKPTREKTFQPGQQPIAVNSIYDEQSTTSAGRKKSPDSFPQEQPESGRKMPIISSVQERSAGIALLTEMICNEAPQPEEEIDLILNTKEGKTELDDARKINVLSKKYSAVGDLKSRWQNWSSTHAVQQRLNPFSEEFDYEYSMSIRLRKGEEGYGRPKEGTKTAERARRAEQHIHGEISDMCYVIRTMNDPDPDGKTRVTFGELFDRYVRISDKVVGILLRARKHGKVAFEGEMLWQGQDNAVVITLLV